MRIQLGLGTCLLMACGGGSGEEPRPIDEPRQTIEAEPNEGEAEDVAGGETSEFSGDIGYCPEIVSNEPLALDHPEIATWVALAQGHHEQTLGWQRSVLSNALAGFEEHTRVSIDVSVMRGRELVYGTGGSSSEEYEMCDGLTARQLELEVELRTADGAIVATFRDWFEPAPYASDARLELGWMNPDRDRDGVEFTGSLELGLDPALGGPSYMWVSVSFGADGVSGSLSPEVASPEGELDPRRSPWTPITAAFPDDACRGSGLPIGLDDRVESLGGPARAAFERVARALASAPVPASWTAAPFRSGVPGAQPPPPTEVSLHLGEPTRVCLSGDWAEVEAPLSIVTADARLDVTQPIRIALYGDTGAGGDIQGPLIPAADFTAQTGVANVAFDAGAYGALDISASVDLTDDRVSGRLSVWEWSAFIRDLAAYPSLDWCAGRNCSAQPER